MKNIKKYIVICITTLLLSIPLFFRLFVEYLLINIITLTSVVIFLLGISVLLLIGVIIEIHAYDSQHFELIKKHDVIDALLNKNSRGLVLVLFSITMVMEELIFRYYSFGILNSLLDLNYLLTILISSIAFSLYHIHVWFSFKNLRLLIINLIYPFLMGLYLGYVFLSCGYFSSVIAHFIIAFIMHYNLYRRYNNNKFKNKN